MFFFARRSSPVSSVRPATKTGLGTADSAGHYRPTRPASSVGDWWPTVPATAAGDCSARPATPADYWPARPATTAGHCSGRPATSAHHRPVVTAGHWPTGPEGDSCWSRRSSQTYRSVRFLNVPLLNEGTFVNFSCFPVPAHQLAVLTNGGSGGAGGKSEVVNRTPARIVSVSQAGQTVVTTRPLGKAIVTSQTPVLLQPAHSQIRWSSHIF